MCVNWGVYILASLGGSPSVATGAVVEHILVLGPSSSASSVSGSYQLVYAVEGTKKRTKLMKCINL